MKRVLITGATSGLGRCMAAMLGRRGWRVAVTGRREARLAAVADEVRAAGGEPLALPGSVARPEDVRRHYAAIREAWGGLDWAVLNAGIGDSVDSREFKAENYRRTFETNVLGAAYWLEAVIPGMLAAGSGTIAGVASLAAYRGLPRSGSYCASKAAMVVMLESVRVDLAGSGVKVVTVCPGFVKSEITDRNDPRDLWFLLETEDGVRRMIAGIEAGRRLVHFPWPLSPFMVYAAPNVPSWLYDRIVAALPRGRKKPYVDESAA